VNDSIALGGELTVRRLGFGAMRITGPGIWGEPRDRNGAQAVLRRAVELGANLIDTADSYGPNVSEELIAEALHPYPEGLVIATKGGNLRPGPDQWVADGRPEHLREACEGSLRRLRADAIDLYQLHSVDSRVPWEESVGALAELREAGKVRHVGLCNVTTEHVERARQIVPIVSVQNKYSLVDRRNEDVLRYCDREGLGFIAWFPLDKGALARASGGVLRRPEGSPAQIALAWILARSATSMAIPGTSSLEHLEDNMGAAGVRLDEAELAALEGFRLGGVEGARRLARKAARRAVDTARRLR
jgi:pyridoxine 4-dehydrogenase